MINNYRRQARTAAELGLGWLVPLDTAIPELAPFLADGIGSGIGSQGAEIAARVEKTDDYDFFRMQDAPGALGAVSAGKEGAEGPRSGGQGIGAAVSAADSPRMRKARELAERLLAQLGAGDLGAARSAHDALGELLASRPEVVGQASAGGARAASGSGRRR